MIRTCPTCGDFHADASLLFCPSDGTPLADVSTHDEAWAEATRVVEEKERVLRRKTRRLKLRRVLMTTMTVLITTLVVCVVVVNTYIYLAPQTDAPVVVAAVTPRPSPKPSETPTPTLRPIPDTTSGVPFVPFVPATPTPSPTPTPTQTDKKKTTTTSCTADDRQRLRDDIVATHRAAWEDAIRAERPAIIRESVPADPAPPPVIHFRNAEAVLGTVTYDATFSDGCTAASLTAGYEWQVTWDVESNEQRKRESKTVKKTKTFKCSKAGAAWRCD
jgi:hypothetical protein